MQKISLPRTLRTLAPSPKAKLCPRKRSKVVDHIFQLQLTSLQYTELEEKIPGLKNGMYKSPADGEWKKVRVVAGA